MWASETELRPRPPPYFPRDERTRTRADAGADSRNLSRIPGDERAPQPRCADVFRAWQEGFPDGADKPPRRRTVRNLVCCAGRAPADAGRSGRRTFLRPPYVGHRDWLGLRLDRALYWDEVTRIG